MKVELTQKYKDAEEDGHQRPCAESRGAGQSLGITHLHVAVSIACAHPNRKRAGAALDGKFTV